MWAMFTRSRGFPRWVFKGYQSSYRVLMLMEQEWEDEYGDGNFYAMYLPPLPPLPSEPWK